MHMRGRIGARRKQVRQMRRDCGAEAMKKILSIAAALLCAVGLYRLARYVLEPEYYVMNTRRKK